MPLVEVGDWKEVEKIYSQQQHQQQQQRHPSTLLLLDAKSNNTMTSFLTTTCPYHKIDYSEKNRQYFVTIGSEAHGIDLTAASKAFANGGIQIINVFVQMDFMN